MWKIFIPPFRSIVGWRAFLAYFLTNDKLLLRGVSFSSRCSFCKADNKTLNHLLVTCRVSKQLWMAISSLFGIQAQCDNDLKSLVIDTMAVQLSSLLKALWNDEVVSTVWILWTTRNDAIFNEQSINL